jgi:predicted regulator of Ras-like GTPase activity (Roadblock/LC7/MglB family)
MEAAGRALADLAEISSQVRAAVLLDADGAVLGATGAEGEALDRLAGAARELLAAAEEAQTSSATLTQLEAATTSGSVFVVRDGERTVAATTAPEPTVGLVFYDLKSVLRTVAEGSDAAA